jgi:hypothetical protein
MKNAAPHSASSAAADRAAGCPHCAGAADDARLAHYTRVLRRLTEIGLNAAEALERKIVAEAQLAEARLAEALAAKAVEGEAASGRPPADPPEPAPAAARSGAKDMADLTLALTRASRCVRLTLMLEDKLIESFRTRAKNAAAEAETRAAETLKERKRRNRIVVDRVVREAIQAEAGDKSEYDHQIHCLTFWLGTPSFNEDLGTHTVEALVMRLCRDLGLDPDWDRWAGEAWRNGAVPDAAAAVAARHCPACCPTCNAAEPTSDPLPASGSDPPC